MSSQRGNTDKSRGQKHQNRTAFKNNLHDTSLKTKKINQVVAAGVCQRCKETIDWKIKYKKYKPLTQPRTCNKCHQKAVKQAYYTLCIPCGQDLQVCQKCGQKKEVVMQPSPSAAEQASKDAMMQFELQQLTERQRRTFFRLQETGKLSDLSDNCSSAAAGDEECPSSSDEEDGDGDNTNISHEVTDSGDGEIYQKSEGEQS